MADAVPALDPARLRVLRAVADDTGGATVADLCGVLGGHPNTTRHHVRALVGAGLVQAGAGDVTGRGRGRPAVRYAVTPEGRYAASGAVAGDPAVAEYLMLAVAFADRLAARGVDVAEESRAVGRAWGAALVARDGVAAVGAAPAAAATPTSSRPRVMALLDRLGFSPRAGAESSAIELRTCPLLAAARRHPEVVCQVHAGLVSGADAAYGGSGEGVRLEPFAVDGACHLTLASAR